MTKIAASLASGPLTDLRKTLAELELAGCDRIHFDVEDGTFVPAMNLGVKVIRELRPLTNLPFEVHLMMVNPEWLIPELAAVGVQMLSVHYEACPYPRRTLKLIHRLGIQAGLAFNPATSLPDLTFCLPYLSFILLLTTDPEQGDCPFLPSVLDKIRLSRSQPGMERVEWMADGGINTDNSGQVVRAGVDTLVVGRGIFKDGRIVSNVNTILSRCNSPQ